MITFKVDNLKNMNDCLKPFLDFLLRSGVTDDDVFDSRLVSCELITNVIRHLGETASFEGAVNAENIVISVSSESTDGKKIYAALPDVFAESGRGLYIVKAICCGNVESDGCSVKVYIKRHEKKDGENS